MFTFDVFSELVPVRKRHQAALLLICVVRALKLQSINISSMATRHMPLQVIFSFERCVAFSALKWPLIEMNVLNMPCKLVLLLEYFVTLIAFE